MLACSFTMCSICYLNNKEHFVYYLGHASEYEMAAAGMPVCLFSNGKDSPSCSGFQSHLVWGSITRIGCIFLLLPVAKTFICRWSIEVSRASVTFSTLAGWLQKLLLCCSTDWLFCKIITMGVSNDTQTILIILNNGWSCTGVIKPF